MVHRWRCRHCSFTVWAASTAPLRAKVRSHLLAHHRDQVSQTTTGVRWTCPYCDKTGQSNAREPGLESFRDHLFGHVEGLVESSTHVAGELGGSGNVLVRTQQASRGADNARIHFLSGADIVLFVTARPVQRLRLFEEQIQSWPAWTVVLTTKERPLSSASDLDAATLPIDTVELDGSLSLSGLGESIQSIVAQQERKDGSLSVEFDILPEIVDTFRIRKVFQFLHLLTKRLTAADALAHYYVDPDARQDSSLNVLEQVFDLTITAEGGHFTATPAQ